MEILSSHQLHCKKILFYVLWVGGCWKSELQSQANSRARTTVGKSGVPVSGEFNISDCNLGKQVQSFAILPFYTLQSTEKLLRRIFLPRPASQCPASPVWPSLSTGYRRKKGAGLLICVWLVHRVLPAPRSLYWKPVWVWELKIACAVFLSLETKPLPGLFFLKVMCFTACLLLICLECSIQRPPRKEEKYLNILNITELYTSFNPQEALPRFSGIYSRLSPEGTERCVSITKTRGEGESSRGWELAWQLS